MRIGLAADALGPQLTGIGRYAWNLYVGLSRHRQVSDLSCFHGGRWFKDPSWLLSNGVPPTSRIPRLVRDWSSSREFRNRLFHAPNYLLPVGSGRSIVTVHDLSIFRFPEFHPAARLKAFEGSFSKSLMSAQHIITDTEWIRQELSSFAQIPLERITAVPLGVGQEFFIRRPIDAAILERYGLREQEYVLSVATLEPRKGIEKAIRAFEAYADRVGSSAILVIVGAAGWQNGPLHDDIERAQRRGRVKLLGFVEDDHLPALYAAARLFLFPSVYEGFGLPPIEAMACGVPTVVSNRSCLPEVTRGASMLVDADDTDGFSAAIERGLADDSWRAQAIEDGKRVAESYTWERCVDETIEVYRRVLM